MEEKKINIITTFYNCEKYIEQCLNSLLTQKYSNYHIYLVNDASTDNSDNVIKATIGEKNARVTYIKNEKNKTALENIIYILNNFLEPESIYILVDGDDFLLGNKVFSYVNDIFTIGIGGKNKIDYNSELMNLRQTNKVYFSYGSASWSNGNKCFSRPYSEDAFRFIKKQPYLISHLRCFLGLVWEEMIRQYPNMDFAKDKNGEFYKSGYDTILCIPMLMVCGFKHTFYNSTPLYFYRLHENNDHVKDQNLQWLVHEEALKKPDFKEVF